MIYIHIYIEREILVCGCLKIGAFPHQIGVSPSPIQLELGCHPFSCHGPHSDAWRANKTTWKWCEVYWKQRPGLWQGLRFLLLFFATFASLGCTMLSIYPLVNQHSYGKSPFFIGKSWYINHKWPFSIAMFNYQRVHIFLGQSLVPSHKMLGDFFLTIQLCPMAISV